jgi:hypothetical protein
MAKSYNTPTMSALSPINHPCCFRCQIRTTLVGITLGPCGRDYRTFECSKCDHMETIITEDPLKSKNAGWWDSELKPPW